MVNQESLGRQLEYTFEQTVRLRYLLFLPTGYGNNPDEKWPLIIYLHGIGERGDNLDLVKTHGIPKIVERQPGFPFVAISPQCPDQTWWWDHHITLAGLLNQVVESYAIDAKRVYLTGNSMGGYGAWSLATAYPARFAAIAPICGGGLTITAGALKDVPVWAFHGEEDVQVPLSESERMVNALLACDGDVRFTVYVGVGHDSWTQTYDSPELYRWFLQHSR